MTDVRTALLASLICPECLADSVKLFEPGNFFCGHSRVFVSSYSGGTHRRLSLLLDVEPDTVPLAVLDAYGEQALLGILKVGDDTSARLQ